MGRSGWFQTDSLGNRGYRALVTEDIGLINDGAAERAMFDTISNY